MTLYLLNTVIPNDAYGIWESRKISQTAAEWHANTSFISAIGHDSTADIMSTLLGTTVSVNRISITPKVGDKCLCFKLAQRAPEGVILNRQQIEELGYHWVLMTYHGTLGRAIDARFDYLEGYCGAISQRV
jgi:hypothetical protein